MEFLMYPKWVAAQVVNTADEEEALLEKLYPDLKTEQEDDPDADDDTVVDDPATDESNTADEEEQETDGAGETETSATSARRGRRARA